MELLKVKKKYKYIDDERQTELMVQLKNSTSIADVEHSFNALYDNMTKLLWNNLTRKYVPPLNHDDMKDVFQDSWVKVIDSRLMFDDSKKAYTWIFTIFKNMIIDRIRFFDRKKTQSMDTQLDDEGFTREFKADDKTDADFNVIENEKLFHIKKAILELEDELDRIIINKRIIENKKFEDISKELEIPIATIHYKLNKSLTKLRKKLIFLVN